MGIGILGFLAEDLPGFAVNGSNVTVINAPAEFHAILCDLVGSAKNRTILAALYLGTGMKEQTLIDNIRKSLDADGSKVRVRFLLDYHRGSRYNNGKSSCTMLLPLVDRYQVINCTGTMKA